MIKPLRASLRTDVSCHDIPDDLQMILRSKRQSVTIAHDGFSIGSHRRCDLHIVDSLVPPWHSVIHLQAGVIWIEAADEETVLIVNHRPCRRRALRHGDQLMIGDVVYTIEIVSKPLEFRDSFQANGEVHEDLSTLSAEELCDRIETEQSMVKEMSQDEKSGWAALLHAIEAVHREPALGEPLTDSTIKLAEDRVSYDAMLSHIEELHETISDQTQELSQQEADVMASSSSLEESQKRVAQRLDEIIEQFTRSDAPGEFRASA